MTILSNMQIKLREGTRTEAVKTFINRKVFAECAEAIPGFLWAHLLEVEGAPDTLSVMCGWADKASYDDWIAHPVRSSQEADLVQFLAEAPKTLLYTSKAAYGRQCSTDQA